MLFYKNLPDSTIRTNRSSNQTWIKLQMLKISKLKAFNHDILAKHSCTKSK